MDSLKILQTKILGSCISPTQKYGRKLCFSHKFDGKRLFTFQIFGGCQSRSLGVGVTTVSSALILGGWVTKVLKNCDKK